MNFLSESERIELVSPQAFMSPCTS